ncbi:MAG: hypothetical protein ACRC33_04515 [Gemmataceae bacterium]
MRTGLIVLLYACCAALVVYSQLRPDRAPALPKERVVTRREAIETVKGWRGQDLRERRGEAVDEMMVQLRSLGLERGYGRVWSVRDFGKKGEPGHYLLLDGVIFHLQRRWSLNHLHLTLLSGEGNVLAESLVATSCCSDLFHPRLEASPDGGYPLVVFEARLVAGGGGPVEEVQYYGCVGRRFDLVRVEDGHGAAGRNYYLHEGRTVGPRKPRRDWTEDECLADLTSGDRLRALRTLVWLGGRHWDLKEPDLKEGRRQTPISESGDQVRLVRKLRGHEKVVPLLKRWSDGDDRWLREAARLAAEPDDTH